MKKIINLTLMCLLTGCATQQNVTKKPMLGLLNPVIRDTASMSWIQVIPSERAIEFKGIAFDYISRHIRHNMANDSEAFNNITLILVDYAILPATSPKIGAMRGKNGKQTYCKDFIEKPERYFLRLSFYENNQRPPSPPAFMETEVLSVEAAPLSEALCYMVNEITREYIASESRQVQMNLDVEPLEKSVRAPSAYPYRP